MTTNNFYSVWNVTTMSVPLTEIVFKKYLIFSCKLSLTDVLLFNRASLLMLLAFTGLT